VNLSTDIGSAAEELPKAAKSSRIMIIVFMPGYYHIRASTYKKAGSREPAFINIEGRATIQVVLPTGTGSQFVPVRG
jgi:hypothetical protein